MDQNASLIAIVEADLAAVVKISSAVNLTFGFDLTLIDLAVALNLAVVVHLTIDVDLVAAFNLATAAVATFLLSLFLFFKGNLLPEIAAFLLLFLVLRPFR